MNRDDLYFKTKPADVELPHFGTHIELNADFQLPLDAAEIRWLFLEMGRCQTLDELFDLVSKSFGSLSDVALVRIWLVRPPRNDCATCRLNSECMDRSACLHLVSSSGTSITGAPCPKGIEGRFRRFPMGVRKIGQIAATGASFHVQEVNPLMDWVADPQWIAREDIHSVLGQPLIHKKEILGVLALFSRGRHGTFVMERLRMVADHLAMALANARAFEELSFLKRQLEIENDYLRHSVGLENYLPGLVGESPALQHIKEQILQVAPTDAVVLITGESGTGKELVATELHRQSTMADGPLVKVNCPSIPRELFESEFFGHAKGAFTGAQNARIGFFEAANEGTLFLDEIGEIPLTLQSKLLRVLQEREFNRVGEEKTRKVHARVIAATNRDLAHMVAAGRFRQDLFYRLNVFPIQVPALRDRPDDIPLLAEYFLREYTKEMRLPPVRVTQAQMEQLKMCSWPGNIRELQNTIRRAVITASGGRLNLDFLTPAPSPPVALPKQECGEGIFSEQAMRDFERDNVRRALLHCGGKIYGKNGAAALLGIRPTTLVSRIAKLGLDKESKQKNKRAHSS